MVKKYFEFKGQMINYYNKVCATAETTNKYDFVTCGFDMKAGKYCVSYSYTR